MASPKGFFKLPGEIRNKIYRLIVSPDLPDLSTSDSSSATSFLGPMITPIGFDTSILYTNHQISEEATHVFYCDHLFARVRFPFSSAVEKITKLGLQKTIRRNAENCPWITMAINVAYADDTNESEGPPVDIVVAHHDTPLLANLLLYIQQRVSGHLLQRPKLKLKMQVVNEARVSATVINQRLLMPLTHVRGYDSANLEFCDPEVAKDFERHPPPCTSSSGVQYIVAQLSLARVLERNQDWQGTSLATKIALAHSDKMIERVSAYDEPDSTTLVTLLKLRIEALVYNVSRAIRTGGRVGRGTILDLFLGYCQALDAAQPTTRLLPLCQALEQYLRLAQGDPSSMSILENIVKLDPQNDLKLDARAMLQMFNNLTYLKFADQMNRSLRFSELSATFSRLYTIAGIQ